MSATTEVMESALKSPLDRPTIARRKDPQKSKITNGALLPGCDQRGPWIRRLKDLLGQHLADVPDASAAERAIIRRASVLIVELERMERQFALAGEADPETLDFYGRVAGNMRRLLESVGLQRRARDVTPSLSEYLAQANDEAAS